MFVSVFIYVNVSGGVYMFAFTNVYLSSLVTIEYNGTIRQGTDVHSFTHTQR